MNNTKTNDLFVVDEGKEVFPVLLVAGDAHLPMNSWLELRNSADELIFQIPYDGEKDLAEAIDKLSICSSCRGF